MLDLSGSLAGGAGLYVGLVLGASPATVRAGAITLDGDLFFNTLGDFLEGKADPRADVPAFIDTGLGTAGAGPTESAESSETASKASEATSEQVSQNVLKVTETAAEIRPRLPVNPGEAELVVPGLLVGIAEH